MGDWNDRRSIACHRTNDTYNWSSRSSTVRAEGELPKNRLSARTYLLGLVAAAILPVWLFAAYVLINFAIAQQQSYRVQAEDLAHQAANAVDGALRDMLVRIDGFARSAAMVEGDLARAHVEARRLVSGSNHVISLRSEDARQYFNTDFDFGALLPPAPDLSADDRAALMAGKSRISNVYPDPRSGRFYVAAFRPLELPERSAAFLMISLPVSALQENLRSLAPEGWVIGVGDRQGTYVTRSERHEEVVGKPGAPEYLDKAKGRSGNFTSTNLFGEHLLAGYYRSDYSGWLFGANVLLATVEAPLWQSLQSVAGVGLIALIVSLFLAYLLGKMMTGETRQLTSQAHRLGARLPLAPLETRFSEFEAVNDAFIDADAMISERTSELEAVLDTVPVGVWFTYDPSGRQVIRNRYAATLMGLSSDPGIRFGEPQEVIDTVATKDGQPVSRDDRPLTKAMRGQATDNEEFLYTLPAGGQVTLLSSARPISDSAGKIIGAVQVSLDISERKRSEMQRRLLSKELDHRVKNNLAIVQSLVQQSLRNAASLKDAQSDIVARLASLASAHDILTKNSWIEGDLEATIVGSIKAQVPQERVSIEGPQVSLTPGQVMTMSLAIHELATNALKYGALSNSDGKVTIEWRVDLGGHDRELSVVWTERDGPEVTPPTRRGFGARLLERMTASEGGSATRTFAPEGLICTLKLPLRLADTA